MYIPQLAGVNGDDMVQCDGEREKENPADQLLYACVSVCVWVKWLKDE